jgi:hypothetical protein
MSLVFNFCNLTFFPTYFISVHKTLCRATFGEYSQKTGTNVNTYCNELGLFYFTMEVYYTESSIHNS